MRLPAWLFAAVCLPAVTNAHAAETGVVGTWRGPENSVISIAPCGSTLCARVLNTGNETAARVDTNNPNAALRTRPLCGLQIGEGFHGSDPNKADGGHLYDPRNGKTYKGSLSSEGDVLLLRGYIGVSMFGRTARWERVREPVEMCNADKPAGAAATPAAAKSPVTTPAPAAAPATPTSPATPVAPVAPAAAPVPASSAPQGAPPAPELPKSK